MKRYGVLPSDVCLQPAAVGPEISIDCCTAGAQQQQRRANAYSATLPSCAMRN